MDWLWVLIIALRGVSSAPDDQWATRLAELDRARADAFASADPVGLAAVYVDASEAGREDAAAIAAYAERDGRVVGAELRILSCRVLRESASRARLEVVDQLGPSRVVWGDGEVTDLPRDRPSRRVVTLKRTSEGWRIAEAADVTVSPQAEDAPSP